MATRYVAKRTHRFSFINDDGDAASYVLTFGDEVDTLAGPAPSGAGFESVRYRGRDGETKAAAGLLSASKPTELYFLDVGQGDAAFVVTPNGTTILVDGGLRERALGFLIWKYRLDQPGNTITIDHLFLSHADRDHVEGLIPLLAHPNISVVNIHHNGIALFDSGFSTDLGDVVNDELVTLHDTTNDLVGTDLASQSGAVFAAWITAVDASGATYHRRDRSDGVLNIGDPTVTLQIIGPVLNPSGNLAWLDDKSHTINGHSLTFMLTHGNVRAFFAGDLNVEGSQRLVDAPTPPTLDAHIFKAPHHGSHEYNAKLLKAIHPLITVVSSGEVPDHGHPRANFLASVGLHSRGEEPLLFSTALAALFVDANDPIAARTRTLALTPDEIRFDIPISDAEKRERFKRILPGIINIRTDGTDMYAFRRIQQSYQWESYGPIAAL